MLKFFYFIILCQCMLFTFVMSNTSGDNLAKAILHNDSELIAILMKYGDTTISPVLNRAMAAKDYAAVKVIVEYGVNIDSRDLNGPGKTVLETAVEINDFGLIEYFLGKGADPLDRRKYATSRPDNTTRIITNYVLTAVSDVIQSGDLNVLILFGEYGVDLNQICYEFTTTYIPTEKFTPLQLALRLKKTDMVTYLISKGVRL